MSNKLVRDTSREQQRFSIRKLTVGAASVLLGTMLFWGGANTTQAETTDANANQASSAVVEQKQETQETPEKQDVQASAQNDSHNQTEASTKPADNKQAETPAKQDETQPAQTQAKQIASSDFNVKKVSGSTYDSNNREGQASYESLHLEINIPDTNKVNAGDYLDINWGIPYKDSQNNDKVRAFDRGLAKNSQVQYQGQIIGDLTALDNLGYRITFNDNLKKFNDVTLTSDLQWSTWSSQASANTTIVHQYTDDKAQDGKTFTTTIPDDVEINGSKYSSGMNVTGSYVYNGQLAPQNTENDFGVEIPYGYRLRSWTYDTKHMVQYTTNWFNEVNFTPDLDKTGHHFTLTVTVPDNQVWNYDWITEDQLKNEIKQVIADSHFEKLSDAVTSSSNLYLTSNNTDNQKPDPGDITVKRTINDNNGVYTASYEVNIPNNEVQLKGTLHILTVSHDGYTMPTTIKNGNDEYALGQKAMTPTFGNGRPLMAGVTSNEELMHAMQNTGIAYASVVNNDSGKSVKLDQNGSGWVAPIARLFDNTIPSSGEINVSDLVTAHLVFKDDSNNKVNDITSAPEFLAQNKTGETINFNGSDNELDDYLASLLKAGYQLDKVVLLNADGSVNKEIKGTDANKLSSYDFGSFDKQFNSTKSGQMEYVVYVKKDSTPAQPSTPGETPFEPDTPAAQPTDPSAPVLPEQPTNSSTPSDSNETALVLPQDDNKDSNSNKSSDNKKQASTETAKPLAQNVKAQAKHGSARTTKFAGSAVQGQSAAIKQVSAVNAKASANKLPQTGAKQNKFGLIGLAFASVAALFGLSADRKKQN